MPRIFPLSEYDSADLRNGTVLKTFLGEQLTGADSTLWVDQTAVSVAELPISGNGLAKSSVTIANASATDGVVEVTVASAAASGTYLLVVRFQGSGAGIGSYKLT